MTAFLSLMKAFLVPIVILNILGDIVSGIWLAIIGAWWALGYGIISMIVSTFTLPILLLPSLPFSMLGSYFEKKRAKTLTLLSFFLSSLYVVSLITVWCTGVLYYFASRAHDASIIPILIWSYGVAIGPWAYMAQREGSDSLGSFVGLFFASLGYIIMIIMVLFAHTNLVNLITAMGIIMAFALVFQFKLAVEIDRTGIEDEGI